QVWREKYTPLKKMTIGRVAKALYEGYDLKPSFEIGDWVTWKKRGFENVTCRITGLDKEFVNDLLTYYKGTNDAYQSLPKKWLSHATNEEIRKEKERRWWAKHNRKPWELKP